MGLNCCANGPDTSAADHGVMVTDAASTDGTPDEFEALAGRCAVFRFDAVR